MRSFRTNEATANENGKKKNRNASRFYFENRFSWSSNRVVQRGKRVCNLKFILSGSEDGRGIATNAHTHTHTTHNYNSLAIHLMSLYHTCFHLVQRNTKSREKL